MDQLNQQLVQLLQVVSQKMKKEVCDGLNMASGLTLAQYQLLEVLASQEKMTMASIATTFGIKPASATSLVDKLVAQEWIIRESGTEDRRKIWIRISDKKKKEWENFQLVQTKRLEDFMDVLNKEQKQDFIKVLETLAK